MLAVICGFIVLQIIGFFFFLIMFVGAIAGGSSSSIPKEGVLDLNMSEFVIAEQGEENPVPCRNDHAGGSGGPF